MKLSLKTGIIPIFLFFAASFNAKGQTAHYIGEAFGGGIIFYIDNTGEHGLIASSADIGTATWYNKNFNKQFYYIGGTSTDIGTGSANTAIIIASQTNTGKYAAKLCRDYTGGGYTDWYLPSKDELNEIYINRAKIGGFGYNYYASSEFDFNDAWSEGFLGGFQATATKDYVANIRAVRSF